MWQLVKILDKARECYQSLQYGKSSMWNHRQVSLAGGVVIPLMTLTLLSVYCLINYVVWLDFMPVNVTLVYQLLPMDSENDLGF